MFPRLTILPHALRIHALARRAVGRGGGLIAQKQPRVFGRLGRADQGAAVAVEEEVVAVVFCSWSWYGTGGSEGAEHAHARTGKSKALFHVVESRTRRLWVESDR